jgi:hypothetical protein
MDDFEASKDAKNIRNSWAKEIKNAKKIIMTCSKRQDKKDVELRLIFTERIDFNI